MLYKISRRLTVIMLIFLFALSLSGESFARRGGFRRSSSRSSFRRSSSRSSRKSYSSKTRSTGRSSSSSRRYSKPSTKPSTQKSKPTVRTSTRKSSSKSYGRTSSSYKRPSTTPSRSSYKSRSSSHKRTPFRKSSSIRQKNAAMEKARTSSSVSTKGMTSKDKRDLKARQRKYSRDLKSENRRLKRQVRTSQRETARERRRRREAEWTRNVYISYPQRSYTDSLLRFGITMAAIRAIGNMHSGIYFYDRYNHGIHHSWLWHYHHRDYDRTHWSREQQMEYARWRAYYDSQKIQPNKYYVDKGTSRDEDYIQSYVDQRPDEFYGTNAQQYEPEIMPDESVEPELILTHSEAPARMQPVRTEKVVVVKKSSAVLWFVVIFGGLLIVGIIALVMYNKGYF